MSDQKAAWPVAAGAARPEGFDEARMGEALALAERGRGHVSPNPVVGAVIVKDGEVVGRGWHGRYGGPHAEVMALEEAGERARGATLYVTLEPCCVWGNTPPCTEAVAGAGIREVVAAIEDPNPAIAGRGVAALRSAGITVRTGVLATEAAQANPGYLRFRRTGLPSVLLKLALSLDGRVSPPPGGPRWTSSERSRELVHAMRARVDCVLVGVGTVLADDPLLTDRRPGAGSRQPSRLVLDSNLRTPPGCAVVSTARDIETIVACGADASRARERALVELGVKVWRFERTSDGRVDAAAALRAAAVAGKLEVLAEGGPGVASTLLNSGLAERVAFFVSPLLYGSEGVAALGALAPGFADRASFGAASWTDCGGDMLFQASVEALRPDRSSRGTGG